MPKAKPKAKAAPVEAAVPAVVETPAAPAPAAEQDGPRAHLVTATGTRHEALSVSLISDAVAALGIAPSNPHYGERSAATFGLMAALAPRDGIEGALAAQFTALHGAGMQCLRRAANPALPDEIASRLRRDATTAFKTAADLIGVIETRRGGGSHQRVTVEHVTVQAGGQAIVGAVASGVPAGGRGPHE